MKAQLTGEERAALQQAVDRVNAKLEWGRLLLQKKSRFVWVAYSHRGREIRESSGATDPKEAKRLLKQRRDQIGGERTGGKRFVGPHGERIRVNELLDWLEASYRTHGKLTPGPGPSRADPDALRVLGGGRAA